MIVNRVTDMTEALQIVPIMVKLKERGKITTEIKDFLTIIQMGINNPLFALWIAYDDDKIVGYLAASLNAIRIYDLDHVFIHEVWSGKAGVGDKLMETIMEWAKEHKIDKIRGVTKRHLKPFNRRYKFKPISVIIERRV